jgi:hypothetical protein
MRVDVMQHYGLTQPFSQTGYFETELHKQLLKDIKGAIQEGRLQSVPDVSSQSLRTVRAERALSTTCGLWDYVWNVECRIDKGCRALLPIYEGILTPSLIEMSACD